jgi:predicted ATPase
VLEFDKYIIICDDLQWVDQTSMSFITEILTNLGNVELIRRHCLFVGLYREDEVDAKHPLSSQFANLEANMSINISRVKLSSLSKDDVIEMVMQEFHLPHRIVHELASVVHKKTAGHPMFVIELLNTLLRDSTIYYNSEKRRHCWNRSDINCLQTGESVAELIASNISSMSPKFQRMLHILSCFGVKIITAVVKILDSFETGISTAVDIFNEQGIIDTDGHMIIFTHDLIQQAVYESMDLHQRKSLHLDIGTFMKSLHLDIGTFMCRQSEKSLSFSMGALQLQNGVSLVFQLECIACDQIAFAGHETINDMQRLSYAERFLSVGLQCSQRFNYSAATYYFVKGIEFLGEDCWSEDLQLCIEL